MSVRLNFRAEDALSSLLRDVRSTGGLFDQSAVRPPWSLRFLEEAPLTLLTMLSGEAWLMPDDGAAVPLHTGDVVIVVGPGPYTVADDPGTPPLALVHDARRCTTPDGQVINDELPMCR